jgi:hypothetical protein
MAQNNSPFVAELHYITQLLYFITQNYFCEISSSHGGEYDVQSCLLAARTSETSVDNHFTRQYNPEDSSEQNYF